MAYIRPLANGHFRADVRKKGILKNKTFSTHQLAQAWAESIESSIKNIPRMNPSQLLALSDADIASMGGEELFAQLGVDLFSVRHAAKLEPRNGYSGSYCKRKSRTGIFVPYATNYKVHDSPCIATWAASTLNKARWIAPW